MVRVIRNAFDKLWTATRNRVATHTPTLNTQQPYTTPQNQGVVNQGPDNFSGEVSFKNLLKQGGATALEQHLTKNITNLGHNLKIFEGQTFVISNREFDEKDADGLKQASGKYNDQMVVAKVVDGQIKLVSNKVFDVSTTPDIGSNYHRNDRAVVPDGMIEKFRANSRGYKKPGTIAFDMVDSGWDRIQRVLAGSGAYNRLDEADNPTCIFHTGGSNTAGGQGCIVFKPEDQETIKNLLASSQGGEFNKLVLDSGKQTLNTVA